LIAKSITKDKNNKHRIRWHGKNQKRLCSNWRISFIHYLFIMAKCLNHQDSMGLIETLRNLPGVEEVKTEIVLDRIKEDHSIIIPE